MESLFGTEDMSPEVMSIRSTRPTDEMPNPFSGDKVDCAANSVSYDIEP
jgi:hypothetical protein